MADLINETNELLIRFWDTIGSDYSYKLPEFPEDNNETDIMMCLVKIRVATEGLLRYIILYEKMLPEDKISDFHYQEYLNRVSQGMFLSSRIHSKFSEIQLECNNSVHFKTSKPVLNDAVQCVMAFNEVLKWFLENYEGTSIENSPAGDSFSVAGIIPGKIPGYIIKRENEIKKIHEILSQKGHIYIQSESGMGKTEICKQYTEKYSKEYYQIYYVENPTSLKNWIMGFPIRIPGIQRMSHDTIFTTKKDRLLKLYNSSERSNKKLLLIMDNYELSDDDKALFSFILPDKDQAAHLIITSTKDNNLQGEIYHPEHVSSDEYYKLFSFHNVKGIPKDKVSRLCNALHGNLRAVKMAARFLYSNAQIDIDGFTDQLEELPDFQDMDNVYSPLTLVMEDLSKISSGKMAVLSCLTMIPYSGFVKRTFIEMVSEAYGAEHYEKIAEMLDELEEDGWVSINRQGSDGIADDTITMAPLLSDTVFTRNMDDWDEAFIREFIRKGIKKISDPNKMTETDLVINKPFFDHVLYRISQLSFLGYDDLSLIRDYYISVYDLQGTENTTKLINELIEEHDKKWGSSDFVHTSYKEGLANLNIEEFDKAAALFDKYIGDNKKRISEAEYKITTALAYEAHALSGCGRHEEAVKAAEEGIRLRKQLADKGHVEAKERMWISYYNYALSLFHSEKYDEALDACERSMELFKDDRRKNIGYHLSSPLHLRGQIRLAVSGDDPDKILVAIRDIEDAKAMRVDVKNYNYWAAQLDVYLAEGYEKLGDILESTEREDAYKKALVCAENACRGKEQLYRTENMVRQINSLENVACRIKEKLDS